MQSDQRRGVRGVSVQKRRISDHDAPSFVYECPVDFPRLMRAAAGPNNQTDGDEEKDKQSHENDKQASYYAEDEVY